MTKLTPHQQAMVELWDRHGLAEFVLKDPDAAIDTMGDNPYILAIPLGQCISGRSAVHSFYANEMLPKAPADFGRTPLRRMIGDDYIVDEFICHFTHTVEMPWMLPGLQPTGRKAEVVMVVIVGFAGDRIAYEHLLWDHALLLAQVGILDHPAASGGKVSAGEALRRVGAAPHT